METVHPLQQERERRGWSRNTLAEAMGITAITVFRWEHGQALPRSYNITRLVELFGKSAQELGLEAPPSESPLSALPTSFPTSEPPLTKEEPVLASSPTACDDPTIPLLAATRVVGRDLELAALKQRLCARRTVPVTVLQGLPGVGKTTLAVCLAHDQEVRAHFRDGILWAGLGPEPTLQGVLRRWGSLLGLSAGEMDALQDRRDWEMALRTVIGERRVLFVIDDAWKVEDALPLLIGGPQCSHVVTTRFPLLASQLIPDGVTIIRELDVEQGVILLDTLAHTVVALEPQKAAMLVRFVGSLPLALTLIGNYLRKQSQDGHPRRIRMAIEKLHDVRERLRLSEFPPSTRHYPGLRSEDMLSLQSALNISYQPLPPAFQEALDALSVFPAKPQSFSEAAACAVAQCSEETLYGLFDAGMIESVGPERYTLHQIVADYTRTRQVDDAPIRRLLAYSRHFFAAHEKDYEAQAQESHLLQAAIEAAATHGMHAELVQGVRAFLPFLLARGEHERAEHDVQLALEAATALGDEHRLIHLIQQQGKLAQKQGQLAEAATFYQDALQRARLLGEQEVLCGLLNDLGWVTWKQGTYSQAQEILQEGLTLARQRQYHAHLCQTLNLLSAVVADQGDYAASEAYAREGLVFARRLNDPEQIGLLLINLGVTLGEQGREAEAQETFQEGLALARRIGHWEWMGVLLLNLGQIAVYQEQFEQAEQLYQEGLRLAQQMKGQEWIGVMLLNLGNLMGKLGRLDEAEGYLQESLAYTRLTGRARVLANVFQESGHLALARGKLVEAEQHFQAMASVLPERDPEIEAQMQFGLAKVAAAHGQMQQARLYAQQSLQIFKAIGNRGVRDVMQWVQNTL